MARIDIEKIDLTNRNKPVKATQKKQKTYIAKTKSGKTFEFVSAFRKGSEQNRLDAFLSDNNPTRESIIEIRANK